MADEKKNVGKAAPDEVSDVKESAGSKEKKSKEKDAKTAKKSASGKKPRKGIVKYFKDCKAEFKKVVWPTPKETTHNTIVVIVVCLLAGVFVFGIDTLFSFISRLILG